MNIIIHGYGNMGKQVESILRLRKHTIIARVDPVCGDTNSITKDMAKNADMVIEFSLPDAVLSNAKLYASLGLNAVVGTSGWHDSISDVRNCVQKSSIGYLYGSNFSIGANIFFKLTAYAARLINDIPEYDIMGFELHHKKKKDSPSGTAHTLASIILENNKHKDTLVTEKLDRAIKKNELHFASIRGGEIPGTHKILLDSEADTIELTHTARSRKGFALGAVMACEWLKNKKGIFEIKDFINEILANK